MHIQYQEKSNNQYVEAKYVQLNIAFRNDLNGRLAEENIMLILEINFITNKINRII